MLKVTKVTRDKSDILILNCCNPLPKGCHLQTANHRFAKCKYMV